MGRGPDRRAAGADLPVSDRVRLDPGMEARAGNAATTSLPTTEHRLWFLGELLFRRTHDRVR